MQIKVDNAAAWPGKLHTFLENHFDMFLRWETKQGIVPAPMFGDALGRLENLLQPRGIVSWHCPRLTDEESSEISRNGM